MKNYSVEVNENVYVQAEKVLDDMGMDIDTAVRMFLKRVIREQSVAFVLQNMHVLPDAKSTVVNIEDKRVEQDKVDRGEMRKSLALNIFKARGNRIAKNVTYASKNRATYNYWANPNFFVLEDDWTLILNDWVNRKLYLFDISRNSLSASQLVPRADQKDLIDIQIPDDIPGFVDKRSGVCFVKFLIDEIDY